MTAAALITGEPTCEVRREGDDLLTHVSFPGIGGNVDILLPSALLFKTHHALHHAIKAWNRECEAGFPDRPEAEVVALPTDRADPPAAKKRGRK